MDSEKRLVSVTYSDAAKVELVEIWNWNAERYDIDRAEEYLSFLLDRLDEVALNPERERVVPSRPEYRYTIIRKRPKGFGHVAVFQMEPSQMIVSHIFHTAQDWERRLD